MKTAFIRPFVVAVLVSSASAFAQTAPAKDEQKMMSNTSPAVVSGSQKAESPSKPEKKMKEKKLKKDHRQNEKDNTPLLSIYG